MRVAKASCDRIQYPCAENIHGYDFEYSGVWGASKNEDTWYGMPWHSKCRIKYNPESIRWVVIQKTFRTILTAIQTFST